MHIRSTGSTDSAVKYFVHLIPLSMPFSPVLMVSKGGRLCKLAVEFVGDHLAKTKS